MLIAQTKTGKTICLGVDYPKEELLLLRKSEKFICPVCGDDVSLKLGNQRIYHFAHRSGHACREFFERESVYHMEGKRHLYQWLVGQGILAELEYYDSEIQQRPDIMFMYNGKKYALEYQCSTISDEIFRKRNVAYEQQGYLPLWVLGFSQLKVKWKNIFSLSNFDYFFLRKSKTNQFIIPAYCPDKKIFHILGSIQPFSIKNTFANDSQRPMHLFKIIDILGPIHSNPISIGQWDREIEKFKLNCTLRPNSEQTRFLHEIYNHHMNLFLLPPEIGLPVRHSLLIQTPPIIWQSYIFIDCLNPISLNDYIDLNNVERSFYKRMVKKEIVFRNLPQIPNESPFLSVVEYFLQLEKLGIIAVKGEGIFQLKRKITIPKTNREREERKNEFYQKYRQYLLKI